MPKFFRAYGIAALAAILAFTLAGVAQAGAPTLWEDRMVVEAALKSAVPPELAVAQGKCTPV